MLSHTILGCRDYLQALTPGPGGAHKSSDGESTSARVSGHGTAVEARAVELPRPLSAEVSRPALTVCALSLAFVEGCRCRDLVLQRGFPSGEHLRGACSNCWPLVWRAVRSCASPAQTGGIPASLRQLYACTRPSIPWRLPTNQPSILWQAMLRACRHRPSDRSGSWLPPDLRHLRCQFTACCIVDERIT